MNAALPLESTKYLSRTVLDASKILCNFDRVTSKNVTLTGSYKRYRHPTLPLMKLWGRQRRWYVMIRALYQ